MTVLQTVALVHLATPPPIRCPPARAPDTVEKAGHKVKLVETPAALPKLWTRRMWCNLRDGYFVIAIRAAYIDGSFSEWTPFYAIRIRWPNNPRKIGSW